MHCERNKILLLPHSGGRGDKNVGKKRCKWLMYDLKIHLIIMINAVHITITYTIIFLII